MDYSDPVSRLRKEVEEVPRSRLRINDQAIGSSYNEWEHGTAEPAVFLCDRLWELPRNQIMDGRDQRDTAPAGERKA
jgi:hypothetical protein